MRLLKGLRKIPILNKTPDLSDLNPAKLQQEVSDGFFNILLSVYQEREIDGTNSSLSSQDIDAITSKYTNANMAIAGAAAIVPGPLGIFSAVPELILSVGNQMRMVYDMGCAYNKEVFLNKDLLLEIPIFALGGNTNLAALQFADNMPDSPEEALKAKAYDLGEGMFKRAMKQSLITWVPVGGSLIMTVWSKMSSQKIAKASLTFYDDKETFTDNTALESSPELEFTLSIEKIKLLINLLEADSEISEDEIQFITPIIHNADIPIAKKESFLRDASELNSNLEVNLDLLKQQNSDWKDLLFCDLVIMAKRGGAIKGVEQEAIIRLANQIDYDQELVQAIIQQ